jgi:hypothetical protein
MFFEKYKLYPDAKIRKSLLWEYETDKIDWHQMRNVIVQRVIERGRMNDFYAILNIYELEGVIETIKEIPFLNKKDLVFVCTVFEIKKEELKCYTRKQLKDQHWNS